MPLDNIASDDKFSQLEEDVFLYYDTNHPGRSIENIIKEFNLNSAELNAAAIEYYAALKLKSHVSEEKIQSVNNIYNQSIDNLSREISNVVINLIDLMNKINKGNKTLMSECELEIIRKK